VREILEHQGKGHSCGLHTTDMDRARELAEDLEERIGLADPAFLHEEEAFRVGLRR
jgi:hypothetical protein